MLSIHSVEMNFTLTKKSCDGYLLWCQDTIQPIFKVIFLVGLLIAKTILSLYVQKVIFIIIILFLLILIDSWNVPRTINFNGSDLTICTRVVHSKGMIFYIMNIYLNKNNN